MYFYFWFTLKSHKAVFICCSARFSLLTIRGRGQKWTLYNLSKFAHFLRLPSNMSIDHVITLFKIYTTTNFSGNIEILSLVTYMSNLFSMNAIIILLFYAQRTCGSAASSSFIVGTQLLYLNFISNSWFVVTTSTSCLISQRDTHSDFFFILNALAGTVASFSFNCWNSIIPFKIDNH